MKLKYTLLFLVASLLLGGCDKIKLAQNNPSSLSPEEVTQIYYQEDFFNHLEEAIDQIQAVEMVAEKTFTWGDETYTATSHSYENHHEGVIQEYAVQTHYETKDASLDETIVLAGDTFYSKTGPYDWQESEQAEKQSLLFSQLLNFILHDFEQLTIEVEEGGEILHLQNKLDQEIMEDLKYRLDLPLMLSPQADIQLETEYTYDNSTKTFTEAHLHFTIQDLGETFTYEIEASPQYSEQAYKISKELFDIEPVEANIETMNTNPFYYYYETTIHKQLGEETYDDLLASNQLFNKTWMLMPAHIKDQKVQAFSLVHQDMHYYLKDGKVATEAWQAIDYYHDFLNLYQKEEDLIEVEDAEEGIIHERLIFEDFESFKDKVPYEIVDDLEYEVESFYAIDFILDKETQKLMTVFVWSITPEEETPAKSVTFNFSQMNQYTPNLLSDSVDMSLWEAIK